MEGYKQKRVFRLMLLAIVLFSASAVKSFGGFGFYIGRPYGYGYGFGGPYYSYNPYGYGDGYRYYPRRRYYRPSGYRYASGGPTRLRRTRRYVRPYNRGSRYVGGRRYARGGRRRFR